MKNETINQEKESSLKSIIRSFHHRNFRLFFSGQSISLVGTWMQRIALGWLVYQMTNSAFMLGLVGFAGQIPTFLLASFAGVLADRHNRHRILITTQTLAMVQAFILYFLVLFHLIRIWHVIALSIFYGIINAFDMPTRQSFMVEMVEDKKNLGNAIALNSSMVNLARLLGPTAAGLLIAAIGEGACFLINGISYMAVIVSLFMMKIEPKKAKPRTSKVWQELKEGYRYALGFAPIRDVLLIFALVNLVGMPYVVLMPVFAKTVLNGGPSALGFLMGCSGLGALGGAVYLASRKSVLGLGKWIPIAATVFGAALIVFSFSRLLYFSLGLMVLTGTGQMILMATSNTLLQTLVDDDKRGRVMSFYIMAFMGATPIGSLIAGFLASKISATWTVFIGGVICICGAVFFAKRLPKLRKLVRPIYVKMGIIPEIAMGIQSASELSIHRK
ncbi:MAG: MFS transporter [Desulfobacterales bacterium]